MTNSERNLYCRRRREEPLIVSVRHACLHRAPAILQSCWTNGSSAHVGWSVFGSSSCKTIRDSLRRLLQGFLALLCAGSALANLYATRVQLNDGTTNVVAGAGSTVNISYVLNEPAILGTTIDIKSGSVTVRSIVLTNGAPGTLRGTNLVVWDGKDANTNAVAGGTTPSAIRAHPGCSECELAHS